MDGVRFTRPTDLLTAGLVAGVVTHLLFRTAYGDIPPLPRFAGITLLFVAAVEAPLGATLRNRIRTGTVAPGQALVIARAVALAKASSLVGAVMLGAWAGVLTYVLPLLDELEAAGRDVVTAAVGVGCAAVLIAAGLWLEHCCRNPDDQHTTDDTGSA